MNNRRATDSKAFQVGKWVEILTLISLVAGGLIWLNAQHANEKATKRELLSLEQEILDTDIDRNAKIRDHYDKIEMERPLSPAEESRRKYVVERMARQYAKQERLEQMEDELE